MACNASQIVCDIVTIIRNDELLETFDIVYSSIAEGSPLIYTNHNLGLESWCVKDLYMYVHPKALARTSGPYSTIHYDVGDQEMFITTALLLNPHVKTFWNLRREMVLRRVLEFCSELRFVSLVLSFKPKTQEAFHYRMWLIRKICSEHIIDDYLFTKEFKLVKKAAEFHLNNHVAWDYCNWLLDHLQSSMNYPSLLKILWKSLESWIECHVSDASSVNFRQYLMVKLMENHNELGTDFQDQIVVKVKFHIHLPPHDSSILKILLYEIEFNENLILFYPNHETLWFHRRFLVYYWLRVLPSLITQIGTDILKKEFAPKMNEGSKIFYALFVELDETFHSKIKNNDSRYINQYKKWLQLFL